MAVQFFLLVYVKKTFHQIACTFLGWGRGIYISDKGEIVIVLSALRGNAALFVIGDE